MPPNQPSQELTFRDVLSQIDRRLSLLEEDLRSLRAYIARRLGSACSLTLASIPREKKTRNRLSRLRAVVLRFLR